MLSHDPDNCSSDEENSAFKEDKSSEKPVHHSPYGAPVQEPILGEFFELPQRGIRRLERPKVDVSVGPRVRLFSITFISMSEMRNIILISFFSYILVSFWTIFFLLLSSCWIIVILVI